MKENDPDLHPVLFKASAEELEFLIELIQKQFNNDLGEKKSPDAIASEIKDYGSNTIWRWLAGQPAYYDIVCDVASKLKVNYNKNQTVEMIENEIFSKILKKALEEMDNADKIIILEEMKKHNANILIGPSLNAVILGLFKAGGFLSYNIMLMVTNAIAKTILGHGLKIATNAALSRCASIWFGPIGWIITIVWAAIDIAGPAYRVTIPAVVYIAMLRRKNSLKLIANEG